MLYLHSHCLLHVSHPHLRPRIFYRLHHRKERLSSKIIGKISQPITNVPIGLRMRSSESSSIGAYIRYLPSEMNGTHATCTYKIRKNTNIISRRSGSIRSLDTRISYHSSKPRSSMLMNGFLYSRRPEPNMWYPWPSTMMVLPCTTVI